MRVASISKDDILNFYRKLVGQNETCQWKCLLCPDTRNPIKQKEGSGFTNLRSHLNNMHPDYISKQAIPNSLDKYLRPKTTNLYGWLKKIILNLQPLSIVENQIELEFTKLQPICRKTIRIAIKKTYDAVFKIVTDMLPERFCLCFDAWTENGTHFVAIYAIFNDSTKNSINILIGFSTLIDECNWSAQNYADTLIALLHSFNKSVDNIVCLVGDNCATNKSLANILSLPLIGCASHRLNLAIEKYINEFPEIKIVNQLMIKLSTPLKMAKLRKKTDLRPITRNLTRWSSCYNMINRFFEIQDFIDLSDQDLAVLMPTHVQILQLKEIFNELTPLNQLTIYLQTPSLNLADVRSCFDLVIIRHPQMKKYLSTEANIIHSPAFENGVVKIINRKESELTAHEKNLLTKLEVKQEMVLDKYLVPKFDENPYISTHLNINTPLSNYIDLKFLPPTSNIVERLFSLAGRIYTDDRKSLDYSTLEEIIFLNQNKNLWNSEIVDGAM